MGGAPLNQALSLTHTNHLATSVQNKVFYLAEPSVSYVPSSV